MRGRPAGVTTTLAVAVVLLVLAGVAASSGSVLSTHPTRTRPTVFGPGSGRVVTKPTATPSTRPTPVGRQSPPSSSATLPRWVSVVLVTFGLFGIAAGLALLATRLQRSSRWRAPTVAGPAPAVSDAQGSIYETTGAHLAGQVAAAVHELSDDNPRAAVISCWLRLERAAATVGVARGASETSAELARRVFSSYDVDAAALTLLSDLYRAARYGPDDVGEDARQSARAALQVVSETLRRGTPEAAATT